MTNILVFCRQHPGQKKDDGEKLVKSKKVWNSVNSNAPMLVSLFLQMIVSDVEIDEKEHEIYRSSLYFFSNVM